MHDIPAISLPLHPHGRFNSRPRANTEKINIVPGNRLCDFIYGSTAQNLGKNQYGIR